MGTSQQTRQLPLVSCIMPTRNRRPFVSPAIWYFLRQDYPHKELIILDDGEDNVGDLIPNDERIRYERLDRLLAVGAKRNLACEMSHGELIAHWDDDDWMAPHRLSTQVLSREIRTGRIYDSYRRHASAVRVGLATSVPVLTSPTRWFEDLRDVTFQPQDLTEGPRQRDEDSDLRGRLTSAARNYCHEHSWYRTAGATWRSANHWKHLTERRRNQCQVH